MTNHTPAPEPKRAQPRVPKYIVLDANALVSDYWLERPSFVLLRAFLNQSGTVLIVPQIVFEEVVNHYHGEVEATAKEFDDRAEKLRGTIQKLGRLLKGVEVPHITEPDEQQGRVYGAFLQSELERLHCNFVEYKAVSHESMVKRALARKRPFQSERDEGYRDTLIWECILAHCMEKGSRTVFVTNDKKAFCDEDWNLHTDLREELESRGFDVRDLATYRSLHDFTIDYVMPYLRERQDFVALVQTGNVEGLDLQRETEANLDLITDAINSAPEVMTDNPGVYEPSVASIGTSSNVEVIEASEISEKKLLVVFKAVVEVQVSFFLPDYEITEFDLEELSVIDPQWNEHVMLVEITRRVNVRCRLVFDTESSEAESFEVEDVQRAW